MRYFNHIIMKITKSLFIIFLTLEIFGCGNSKTSAQEKANMDVNNLINEYDPILSTKLYYYGQWMKNENQGYFNNEYLLKPNKIKDQNYIDTNITQLLSFVDTVKSYLNDIAYLSAEYGGKLNATLKNNEDKLEFQTIWREYNEGFTEVITYDIEIIGKYLEIFYFLKDNRTSYEVKNDTLYYLDDNFLEKYMILLDQLTDQEESTQSRNEYRTKQFTSSRML